MQFLRDLLPHINTFKTELEKSTARFKTSKTFDKMVMDAFGAVPGATSLVKLKNVLEKHIAGETFKSTDFLSEIPDKNMFSMMHLIGPSITIGSDSLEQLYSFIRRLLKKHYAHYSKFDKIMQFSMSKMFYTEKAEKIKEIAAKVASKNQKGVDRISISTEDVYKIMNDRKESADWNERFIFVMLAIGSRPIEIIKTSQFEPVKDDDNSIKITGVAKIKKPGPPLVFEKPIINASFDEVKKSIDFIRKETKDKIVGKENKDISNTLIKTINNRVKKAFKDILPDNEITSYDMRKIYGTLSYKLFADEKKYSLTGWLNEVLGHQKDNLGTANYYSTVNITPAKPGVDSPPDPIPEISGMENPIPPAEESTILHGEDEIPIKEIARIEKRKSNVAHEKPSVSPVEFTGLEKIMENLEFINKKLNIVFRDGKFMDGLEFLLNKFKE